MVTFHSRDDVLTLLVHLGYLSYDADREEVSIPNSEVAREYYNAVSTMDWDDVMTAIKDSKKLLKDLIAGDAEAVAAGVDKILRSKAGDVI